MNKNEEKEDCGKKRKEVKKERIERNEIKNNKDVVATKTK